MSEELTVQDSSEHYKDISKTVAALCWLSPAKMGRINEIRERRARLLEDLRQNKQDQVFASDWPRLMQGYHGTESDIVDEVFEGATSTNPVTGNLWSVVLTEIGIRADESRRTLIYAELQLERGKKPLVTGRIDRMMAGLEEVDPEVSQRAGDVDYYLENMLVMQAEHLVDTFDTMF